MKDLGKVFQAFKKLMRRRFLKEMVTSEADVRCLLFYALIKTGKYNPEDISLEKRYKEFGLENSRFVNEKIDLHVQSKRGENALAFELEFHTNPANKGDDASSLLWDFIKLKCVNKNTMSAYFIYIFDKRMKDYLKSRKLYKNIICLSYKKTLKITKKDYRNDLSKYEQSWLEEDALPCRIKAIFPKGGLGGFTQKYNLRIYKIEK